ncbi:transglutaminase [Opitutaceae bacterium TAV5]|nr:transglutaminase [Opitutaceae bacterium TAV5]
MIRRPQLSIDELHQVRWLLGGILIVLSAWTVSFMDVSATLLLGIISIAVPVATLTPALAAWVPAWIHRLVFPLVVAFLLCDMFITRQYLPALIRLDLMLLLYRGVTLRRRREDLQLIVLALFLVIVAGVITVSLAFAVQILLFMACTLALLLVLTITEVMPEPPARSGVPPAWVHVNWSHLARRLLQVNNWRATMIAGVIFCAVVGLSAVLFLTLPRFDINSSMFIDKLIPPKSKTGFTENVRFGDVVNLQEDRSVALSVDVSDRSAVPAMPYWRMLALDQYNSRDGFSVSEGLHSEMRSWPGKMQQYTGAAPRLDPRRRVTWTFYMEPGVSRYLPMLGDFFLLTFNEEQSLRKSDVLRMYALAQESQRMIPWRVDGMVEDNRLRDAAYAARWKQLSSPDRPIEPDSTERLGRRGWGWRGDSPQDFYPDEYEDMPGNYSDEMLGRPPPPPDYLRLRIFSRSSLAQLYGAVVEIGPPDDGDVSAFIQRASNWLQQRHGYSMQFTIDRGERGERGERRRFWPDPLVTWMTSKENGHCEMFAGSMVLLARAAGIPARLVTGFKGGSWNRTSGHISIRNSDAHAWCEIFDEKDTWLRVDPTPGSSILPPADSDDTALALNHFSLETETGWASRTDSLRVFWYRRIVSFDQTSQLEMIRISKEIIETMSREWRERIEKTLRTLLERARQPWTWWQVGIIAVCAVIAVGIIWLWRELGIGLWLRSLRGADPVRREASRWLLRLQDARGPFAKGVASRLLRLRYGDKKTWREPATRVFRDARRAVRTLRRT